MKASVDCAENRDSFLSMETSWDFAGNMETCADLVVNMVTSCWCSLENKERLPENKETSLDPRYSASMVLGPVKEKYGLEKLHFQQA
jgi:hypothetical protein